MAQLLKINTTANPAFATVQTTADTFQAKQATFNGTQDFVDITWTTPYATFTLMTAVAEADGSQVAVVLTKVGDSTSLPDGTGVRVIPTSRFTGVVYVTIFQV